MSKILPNNVSPLTPSNASEPVPAKDPAVGNVDLNPVLALGLWGPFSILAGVKFKEETMKASDAFVAKSPLRRAITNQISREDDVKEVAWRERVGALELGFRVSGSIPIAELGCGLGLSFDYGFEPSSLLFYRSARPLRLYSGRREDPSAEKQGPLFPRTVKDATSMPIGQEVELCGIGKLQLREGFSITEGVGVMGMAKVGVGASFAASQSCSGEYALGVIALDGAKQVRVTIRKTNTGVKEFSADFRAGVLSVSSVPLPSFGEGALGAFAKGVTGGIIGSLICNYASVVAHIGSGLTSKNEFICSYDLDLSKESAQRAYLGLLRLSPGVADQLAMTEDSGISRVSLREHEEKLFRTSNFKALNQQLYAKEKAEIDRKGRLTQANGAQVLYRDKIYAERFESIFTGKREIEWGGITVKDRKGRLNTYYRFGYQGYDKVPRQCHVDRYLKLAHRLGINPVVPEKSQLIAMTTCEKLFSEDDDTKASIELFFTEEGVARIQGANTAMGLCAFQRANSDEPLEDGDFVKANAMFEEYQALGQNWRAAFGKTQAMKDLIKSYEDQNHRNFEEDFQIFAKAQEFGRFIGAFSKVDDSKSARDFFALLGKSKSFDYAEVLAALTMLAGRDNLKIHDLSLSGGQVALKSADEGEILHPREGIKMFAKRGQLYPAIAVPQSDYQVL